MLRSREMLLISRCPPYPLHLGDRLIPNHLVQELNEMNYTIDLIAYYQQADDLADVPYYAQFFADVRLVREPVRSPLSLLSRVVLKQRRFPRRRSQSWSPSMWEAIEQRLDQRRMYDIVHLFGGIHVYEFRELLRRYPTIIAPYESYSLYLTRAYEQAKTQRDKLLLRLQLRMAEHYESWMFQGYQRVVVVSEKDAQVFRRLAPYYKVAVIPNGVDLTYFSPTTAEPDKPTLLFTGNYEYAPNLDAALVLARQVFPLVKRAVPDAQLLIIGNNPPARLRMQRAPDVHIPGRVPDLRPYFEGAMCYVSPLRLGAGIKNKILEAMAMQTPVVATPLSCDGIDVIDGEHVLLARRPEDIAQAVIRVLQDIDLRRTLAANAYQLVQAQYTWRSVARMYQQVYDTVIQEHAAF